MKIISKRGQPFILSKQSSSDEKQGGAIAQKNFVSQVNNNSASIPGLGTGSRTTQTDEHRSAGTSVHFGGGYLNGLKELNFSQVKSTKKPTNVKLKI